MFQDMTPPPPSPNSLTTKNPAASRSRTKHERLKCQSNITAEYHGLTTLPQTEIMYACTQTENTVELLGLYGVIVFEPQWICTLVPKRLMTVGLQQSRV